MVDQTKKGDEVVGAPSVRPSSSRLAEFIRTKEARTLQRLADDRDKVLRLGLEGFEGPTWEEFANALAAYGLRVMRSWIRSGKIFEQCARKGCALVVREIPKHIGLELANHTVGFGIDRFRKNVLMKGVWDSTRGATLQTFFIGTCIFEFPNAYRAWLAESRYDDSMLPHEWHARLTSRRPSPDSTAELAAWLERNGSNERMIVDGLAGVLSNAEVAALLGISKSALENRLHRARHRT